MPNLFLAENSSHVRDLISRGMKNEGVWIALGPSAMWCLQKEGIEFSLPEQFLKIDDLKQACLENHERVEAFCRSCDEILLKEDADLKENGMRPFTFNIYTLTVVFDSLVGRIFQLRAILEAHKGYTVWVHAGQYPSFGPLDFLFSDKEPLWGNILSLPGWTEKIVSLRDPGGEIKDFFAVSSIFGLKEKTISSLAALKSFLRRSLWFNNLAFYLKDKNLAGFFNLFFKSKSKGLLVYAGFYNWEDTFSLFRREGLRLLFAGEDFFKVKKVKQDRKVVRIEELIKNSDTAGKACQFMGVCFYPLLESRFRFILSNHVTVCKKIFRRIKFLVRRFNLKAVLASGSVTFTAHAVQHSARNMAIPVFCWQHGFMIQQEGRLAQLNEFNNMLSSDFILTLGEGSTKAHLPYERKFSSKAVSTGSSSLDKIRSFSRENLDVFSRNVLYVTTDYYQNSWYCGFYPPFSDRLFFKDQLSLIEYLKMLKAQADAEITVKFAPATLPPFAGEIRPFFRIKQAHPGFSRLLFGNHIIIIDSPTTTVLEAVATEKPIFVLTSHIKYPQPALELLKKRAFCSDNPKELIEAVGLYMRTGIYRADTKNTEFLSAFGTYLSDGNSAARAAGIVLKVILNGHFRGKEIPAAM